jgi:drug/metabolite transporter (DMT)-like permease
MRAAKRHLTISPDRRYNAMSGPTATQSRPCPPDMSQALAALNAMIVRLPPNLRGMGMMLIATFLNAVMVALVRYVSADLHVFEIAFFRNAGAAVFLAPILMRSGWEPLRTRQLRMHTLRAALNTVSMFLFFYGLTLIPLAQVTALSFATPLFATLCAVVLLRETMHRGRWTGLALGFIGALIILRPGVQPVSEGALAILVAVSVWGGALVVIKMLARTESSVTIVLYASLLQIPLSLAAASLVWVWPSPGQLALLFAIGAIGSLSQMALAQSFREADATVVLPVDFTKLIWASLIGYLAFAEIPDIWIWVGGIVVFSGVLYIAFYERGGRAGTP